MQINAIWLYYNELSFICCILLLAALIIFYPFTGLSYIDIKTLTFDKIQRMDFDGEEWIITRRTKTKVSSNVPLMEIAKELIERYKGLAKDDFVFPMPSNGTCNDHLKKIATVCGINKEVTFHLARHTFATTITLANGVPIESVSKMLGHTDIRTTQIYAKVIDAKLSNDMELLAQKINTKKVTAAI